MGKKIMLAVFTGIALFGLVLMLVGFASGGRMGSITVRDGQFVFTNSRESIALADAPHWADNYHYTPPFNSGRTDASGAVAGQGGNTQPLVTAPFQEGELKKIDIDVAAGYVEIRTGSEYKLEVDGPMSYTARFDNGTWRIKSDLQDANIHVNSVNNFLHFFYNDTDITTVFTFTVPASFQALELDIGAGQATVSGLSLEKLDCSADAGSIFIENSTAEKAELSVSAGHIEATGLSATRCELSCDVGAIEISGEVSEQLNAKCSLGSITAQLTRPNDYGWEAKVGMGEISIDGRAVAAGLGSSSSGGNSSAKPQFELDCDMGSIQINFT